MSKKFWADQPETGRYTPTLTNNTNISLSELANGEWLYFKIGDMVHVVGNVNITATAAGLITLYASLPIPSNLILAGDLSGVASNKEGDVLSIRGGGGIDEMVLTGLASTTTVEQWTFTITYLVK